MSEKIKVCAVPGRMMPHPGGAGRYVGMADAAPGAPADVEIPGGRRYVLIPFEELPTSSFLRRALARGDIALYPGDTQDQESAASKTRSSKAAK